MASRQQRLVENQKISRYANERLSDLVEERVDGNAVPFLCECADLDCSGRIGLTTNDYMALHVIRNQYVILPGHAMTDGERVVGDDDGYLLVQKG